MRVKALLKRIHIGSRIIKTSASAAISLLIANSLGLGFESLAVIAAIIVLQPTVHETMSLALKRVTGAIIGSALALICVYFIDFGLTVAVFFGVLIILTLMNTLSVPDAGILGVIAYVSILAADNATLDTAVNMIINTGIGCGTSIVINLIFPTIPMEKISRELTDKILNLDFRLLREKLKMMTGETVSDKEIKNIQNQIIVCINTAFKLKSSMSEEGKYTNNRALYASFKESHNSLWNIHSLILQIQGDIEYNISHEINNGLTALIGIVDELISSGITKAIVVKFSKCVEDMDAVTEQQFQSEAYHDARFYFVALIVNLRRLAEEIAVFA